MLISAMIFNSFFLLSKTRRGGKGQFLQHSINVQFSIYKFNKYMSGKSLHKHMAVNGRISTDQTFSTGERFGISSAVTIYD